MDALAALITLVAFATRCLSVFGIMAEYLMGVYALALPVQVAMILHGITQLFANGFRAFLLRERIYSAGLGWYALGAAIALACFTWLALVVAGPVLFLLLGAIPLSLSALPRRFAPRFERRGSAAACGALVTAAHLLAGVSGPLLDVFFVRAELDRFEVIATKAVTQTAGHALKILYFAILCLDRSSISSCRSGSIRRSLPAPGWARRRADASSSRSPMRASGAGPGGS
jgi:hypothetical protein